MEYGRKDSKVCLLNHLRPVLSYTVFIRRRWGNVPFLPTVCTEPFSYPASNIDYFGRYPTVHTLMSVGRKRPLSMSKMLTLFRAVVKTVLDKTVL